MSTFGQYVHLHWENYEKYGTYEKQEGNSQQRRNFQNDIFKEHRRQLRAQAQGLKILNLKALEDQYNKLNYDTYTRLKQSTFSNKDNLDAFLHLVNKTWTDAQRQVIMNDLEWDDNKMRLRYKGKGLNNSNIKVGKNSIFAPLPETFYAKPLEQRLIKLNTAFVDFFGENPYNNLFLEMKTEIKRLTRGKTALKEIYNKISNTSKSVELSSGILHLSDSSVFQDFNNMLNEFLSAKSINDILEYRIPEIIGQAGTVGISKLVPEMLIETIESLHTSSNLTQQSGNTKINIALDKNSLKEAFSNDKLKGAIQPIKYKGKIIDYKLKNEEIGIGRAQKTDIEWTVQDNSIIKTHGISMKSTELLNLFSHPTVSLQSSSLMLYLMGIQNMQTNLGNHYLNVLASHSDTEGNKYHSMRQWANDSLTLAILYSALTGQHQMRTGGSANIFAVYDIAKKMPNGVPRVRFFDMGIIFEKLDADLSGAVLDPSIDSISLINDKITGKAPLRQLANKRLTKLLIETRATVIKASLKKEFLQNIYR